MNNKNEFIGKKVKLGDVCTVVSGATPKSKNPDYWGGEIKWVTPAELEDESHYIADTSKHITEAGFTSANLHMLPVGTVLLTTRAPIGKVAITKAEMCCNQGFKNLICSDSVNNEFLYRALKFYSPALQAMGRGATFKELSKKNVEAFELRLPPLDIQKDAVAKFEAIEHPISVARKQLSLLDTLVKSQFVEMFDNASYPNKRLDEVASVKGGLTKSTKREKLPLKLPYLRVANVLSGKLDLSEMKEIGLSQAEVEKVLLKAGDLLFVEGNGSGDQIGRAAIWNGEIEPCVHQNHLIRARCSGQLIPVYALHYFMSPGGRDQIVTKAVSTSGLFTLSTGKIKSLELPVPPLALQQQFADFVARVDKSRFVAQQQIDKLQTLYDSLAQEYFS